MHIFSYLSEPIIYLLAFGVIFSENGILAFFFLPGDTLLFTLGLLAQQKTIELWLIIVIMTLAGFLGNVLGYYIGKVLRDKHQSINLLKKIPNKYVLKTESFYEKYGTLTIILSRFIPIVRTVAPFLAGVSRMNYQKYIIYSLVGSALWVSTIILLGYVLAGYFTIRHVELLGLGLMLAASIVTPFVLYISKKALKKS